MVYRGKPSSGCKKCRLRKIKCDETPNSCLKCAEKGFVCPGYEKTQDRYFQDETVSIGLKVQKAKAKAILARDERDKAARASAAINSLKDSIGIPLLGPLIDQGIAFFMGNYAIGLDQPPMESDAYSRHLNTYGFHPIVATSMTALGLAGIANLWMDGGVKREAMRWYLNALGMTNRALASPTEVKSDNTLLATMLLTAFEATNNERTLMGWANHVSGSASLIRIRGKAQFATPAGRRMYMQTVGLLTMNCMGMGTPLPEFVHEMNAEVMTWEHPNDPGNRFYHLHIAVIDFRAEILQGKITDLDEIIRRALAFDQAARAVFDLAPDDWAYEEECCDQGTPGVFGSYYHIYPHLAGAQTWNWMRYNRIYLHDIIRNALIAGFTTTPPVFVGTEYISLLEESTKTLYKMQADILASIPQYLHDTPKMPTTYPGTLQYTGTSTSTIEDLTPPGTRTSPTWTPSPPASHKSESPTPKLFISNFVRSSAPRNPSRPEFRTPATPTDKLPIVRVSGGYSSIWALYIAGSMPIASAASQAFVLRTLDRVSAEFGINQAKVLGGALRMKIEMDTKGLRGSVARDEGVERIVPDYLVTVGPHVEH